MFRRGLIYVLIVAVVFGPQWCCCAARRCFAGTATSTTDRLPVPSCCCAGGKDSTDTGSREPASCPCKHRPRQAVLDASSPAVTVQELGKPTVADFLSPFTADGSSVPGSRRPLADELFSGWQSELIAGSRDLLRALPVLRC